MNPPRTAADYLRQGIIADDRINPHPPQSGATPMQALMDLPWVPLIAGGIIGWWVAKRK